MKIVTWNIFRHNKKIIELLSYIVEYDPDVLCLQEVSSEDLCKVEQFCEHCNLKISKQFFVGKLKETSIHLYNVIITKHNVQGYCSIAHDSTNIKMPLRYRYGFSHLDINSLYIDLLCLDGNKYRIFNVHFECVASPTIRLRRLAQMRSNFCDDSINIIAGDFNTFANPIISAAVAPLYSNFSFGDFFINERKAFKREIDRIGMMNPFQGESTFKYIRGQYDYIVIPKSLKVLNKFKLSRDVGSDHYGLFLEVCL